MGHLCHRYLSTAVTIEMQMRFFRPLHGTGTLHRPAAPGRSPHRAPRVPPDRRVRPAGRVGTGSWHRLEPASPTPEHGTPAQRRRYDAATKRSPLPRRPPLPLALAACVRRGGEHVRRERLPVGGHWSGRSRSVPAAATTSWPAPWSTSSRRRSCTPRTSWSRTSTAAAAPRAGATSTATGTGYGISTTSGSFITTPLQADTGWTYEDFTPVGLLATDDALLLTPGESDIKTWDDWVAYAKDKSTVASAGSAPSTSTTSCTQLLAEQAGYEIEYVPYNEEGQVQTSLLSGAMDAMVSNPGSILGQIEAGEMTPAAVHRRRAPRRAAGRADRRGARLRDLPSMPRGLILPPGRAGGGAGVVDRHHEEGRRDRRVAGSTSRRTTWSRTCAGARTSRRTWPDAGRVREAARRSWSTVTRGRLRHERHEPVRPRPASRLGCAARSSSWLLLLVVLGFYTEMAFDLEWGTAAGRIGPASSRGSSAASVSC